MLTTRWPAAKVLTTYQHTKIFLHCSASHKHRRRQRRSIDDMQAHMWAEIALSDNINHDNFDGYMQDRRKFVCSCSQGRMHARAAAGKKYRWIKRTAISLFTVGHYIRLGPWVEKKSVCLLALGCGLQLLVALFGYFLGINSRRESCMHGVIMKSIYKTSLHMGVTFRNESNDVN